LLNERAKKASGEAEAQVGDQKTTKEILGGGFVYCLCSPLVSEGFQFDYFFSDGLVQSPTTEIATATDDLFGDGPWVGQRKYYPKNN